MENYRALMPIYTISSLVSIINVSSRLVRNTSNIWGYLKERVFFIYASHTLFFVSFVEVLLYSNLQHQPISILFVIYLLMPFLKITICVIIYNFMAKYMPKSLAILNGRREKRST
jgi:TRAP-type mannitol/chloroaromatic compound transport system permease small subunit